MTAPLTTPAPTATSAPAAPAAPPSPVRAAAVSGLIGGVMGALMSAAVNYAAIGLPDSESVNAVNHAISGLASGFLAGFIGLLMHIRKTTTVAHAAQTAPAPASDASGIPQQAEPAEPATGTPDAEAPVSVPEK
ncbi:MULTISPECIES: hypothetical protein [unclassified Streptomyces]|uniref:hypothetical protein n=1 Tax=unclassified Streptomyces TaxID=2593676 RepID=UPI002DD8D596|nr:hypothetical protein [Streptomyces sp. NBC_01257]WRZ66170.1 hypothetical protein OG408_20880 [Streptomyces sp. NBC_01257]WSU60161.1 hypothetical protein OG450_21040 [Streptomyces sp. NBC_01104]